MTAKIYYDALEEITFLPLSLARP